jgi:hypothetical protein
MGAPSHWVLDPEPSGRLTVFELGARGHYADIASVTTDRP